MFTKILMTVLSATLLPVAVSAAPKTIVAANAPMMSDMSMEHGMPEGKMGADGIPYNGAPRSARRQFPRCRRRRGSALLDRRGPAFARRQQDRQC